MKVFNSINASKLAYIVISLFLCGFGGVLMLRPDMSLDGMINWTGFLLILFGCSVLWGFYAKDLFRLAFQHGLARGILIVSIGIFLLAAEDVSLATLCIIVGIMVLMDGLLKIEMALDAKPFGIEKWWAIFGFGILTSVFGFLLILHPWSLEQKTVRMIAAALITSGLMNTLTAISTIRVSTITHPPQAVLEEESPWGL